MFYIFVYYNVIISMKVFLITYDLRKVGQNYTPLYDSIKSLSSDWQHPMESFWGVRVASQWTAQAIYERLRPNLDENDSLLIFEVEPQIDRQGWMPKKFWAWLNNN